MTKFNKYNYYIKRVKIAKWGNLVKIRSLREFKRLCKANDVYCPSIPTLSRIIINIEFQDKINLGLIIKKEKTNSIFFLKDFESIKGYLPDLFARKLGKKGRRFGSKSKKQ
ncbi:hypothetical protein [Candidatus Venteria ishoeyi]|uniref:hypothetical protein n=1 Tax=Candidatus Venteria ishoeyi TaxID=1899563 RepID=UPI000CDE6C26|nr:hypothetical protein [Candidatus Venteria ishoeyi]